MYYFCTDDPSTNYCTPRNPGGTELTCNSCQGIVGRADARLLATPKWCSELSTSVAGGCDAWYAADGSGGLTFCAHPSSGSSCTNRNNAVNAGSCESCLGTLGRRDSLSQAPAQQCHELSTSVTGGCNAWLAHTASGTYGTGQYIFLSLIHI